MSQFEAELRRRLRRNERIRDVRLWLINQASRYDVEYEDLSDLEKWILEPATEWGSKRH